MHRFITPRSIVFACVSLMPGQARAEAAEKSLADLRVKYSAMEEAGHDLKRR